MNSTNNVKDDRKVPRRDISQKKNNLDEIFKKLWSATDHYYKLSTKILILFNQNPILNSVKDAWVWSMACHLV